ncbi:hypothetical protein [Fluviispira vulneris]|uniref:hypothetical protein n=1 Tax=Fluviispira vulneris TaxID=2763012 RepID=UPI0016476A83|nr:hypothetical protein [Fluviispira vulneris]
MKFLLVQNRIYFMLFCLINVLLTLFLSSCSTFHTQTAKTTPQKKSQQNSISLQKALIFYASDDPILLPYFSSSFTRRIAEDGIYHAVQNRNLNKEWMANSNGSKADIDVEHRFQLYAQNIKTHFLKKRTAKVSFMARSAMKEALVLLSNNPSSVGFTYAELAFWAAVANWDIPHVARSYALIYEKYATFALKDKLESQVDVLIINKLKDLTNPYLVKQKTVKLLNTNKCAVFLNGQELKTKIFQLPAKMTSVISANCINGSFSQTFSADRQSVVKISPYFPTSFYSMPDPQGLPKEEILKERAAAVILIYWSHSERYLDSLLIEPKAFSIVKKTRISLSTREDLDQAGDNLMAFLKSASDKISKNKPSHLTAGN